MSTLLLVRHGLTAMTGPVLAGRTPGVHLDERGQKQASALAERVAKLPLTAIVTSPLERCVETAQYLRDAQPGEPAWHVDERLIEAGYGDWTGKPLKDLMKEPLWKVVQSQPSAVRTARTCLPRNAELGNWLRIAPTTSIDSSTLVWLPLTVTIALIPSTAIIGTVVIGASAKPPPAIAIRVQTDVRAER